MDLGDFWHLLTLCTRFWPLQTILKPLSVSTIENHPTHAAPLRPAPRFQGIQSPASNRERPVGGSARSWRRSGLDEWWLVGGMPQTPNYRDWREVRTRRHSRFCGRTNHILVGGWATPLKNMSSSIGMIRNSQYFWEKCQWMATKPPTRYNSNWETSGQKLLIHVPWSLANWTDSAIASLKPQAPWYSDRFICHDDVRTRQRRTVTLNRNFSAFFLTQGRSFFSMMLLPSAKQCSWSWKGGSSLFPQQNAKLPSTFSVKSMAICGIAGIAGIAMENHHFHIFSYRLTSSMTEALSISYVKLPKGKSRRILGWQTRITHTLRKRWRHFSGQTPWTISPQKRGPPD